ncbi:MAG: hypothetical protein L0Y72_13725 [Gemmataceae bacterium]|nr:hypothetical protein [Gemmataceae bacterium]MCI0740100.1 hypothetical protein [Gemmataceae bacterium]
MRAFMPETLQQLYEDLADQCDRKREARQRDWFLALAADAAFAVGRPDEAERLRKRLLQFSPHHLLRPFASFAEAARSADVEDFLADLRRRFPPEDAEKILLALSGSGFSSEAPAEPAVFPLKNEPARPASYTVPTNSGRRTHLPPAAPSPYDVPVGVSTMPTAPQQPRGTWFVWLLFLAMLALSLAIAYLALLEPLILPIR